MNKQTVYVFKGSKAQDTYVYLPQREDFSCLPASLADRLGPLTEVLELELWPERKLARAKARQVLESIAATGYYVQMPDPEERLLENDQLLWPD